MMGGLEGKASLNHVDLNKKTCNLRREGESLPEEEPVPNARLEPERPGLFRQVSQWAYFVISASLS